ncbi:MAG: DMT family transporter [Actinomycetota bacterium]
MTTARPLSSSPKARDLPPWATWALLILGTLAASISAILIRYATEAHPLAISFWRCSVGAAVLLPFAGRGLRKLGPSVMKMPAWAGFFLAIHFATWITSIDMTSIAASVLLVSTAPIFIAIAARYLLAERLPTIAWVGIGGAMLGAVLISGTDFGGSSHAGNILALIGGATAGWYFLAGQVARRDVGILQYAVIAYGVAAALLLAVCVVIGVELAGYPASTWWAIAGLIVGPQLLGHTIINLVLSDIDATTVSVTIMAEPIIAIALAYLLFSEAPSWLVYPGGAAILAGIYVVSTERRQPAIVVE